jgi:nucleoside-diphosphate-sugar epimerase
MDNILVIGAAGQIGSELVIELRKVYGSEHVFATDIKQAPPDVMEGGPYQVLDVMDDKQLIHFIIRHKINQIYHLAAVLSGNAEKLPVQAWKINMDSLMNILEVAKMVEEVKKVFWPSSIAVFGPTTPRTETPQLTVMEPVTVYGIRLLLQQIWGGCEKPSLPGIDFLQNGSWRRHHRLRRGNLLPRHPAWNLYMLPG